MRERQWLITALKSEASSGRPSAVEVDLGCAADAIRGMPARSGEGPESMLALRAIADGKALREAVSEVQAADAEERQISPAGRWLLENFRLIEEHVDELARLRSHGRAMLPLVADAESKNGVLRIWWLARCYLARSDNHFDPAVFAAFIAEVQNTAPLDLAELWALPLALRSVMVENLRKISVRVADSLKARRDSESFAAALARPVEKSAQLPPLPGPGARGPFLLQLARQLQKLGPEAATARAWMDQQLAANGISIDDLAQQEHVRQGGNNVSVSRGITSLRTLGTLEWREFVERASLVEASLRRHPGYAALDFLTRDRYRRALVELAHGADREELEVADALVRLSSENHPPPDIGKYLLTSQGRSSIEKSIGYRPSLAKQLRRHFYRHAIPIYLASLVLVTTTLLVVTAKISELPAITLLLLLPLALFPAAEIAVALVNHLLQKFCPPRHLPRLELADGISPDLRTLVVMPVLLKDRAQLEADVQQLEVHALANPDREFRFALLADWRDSAIAANPEEEPLLAHARRVVAELNLRHGSQEATPRFLMLVRRRVWSETERCFMGWERKRGKLWELNRLLRGATDTTYEPEIQGAALPTDVRYVITLDADTRAPPGAFRRLVGTAAHPLNRPEADANGVVHRGYGILQPRITPLLPMREERSIYRDIVSGASGLDPYAGAVSDLYQDVFGEGSFTGKGLYDIDAFMAAIGDRLPPGRVLSHDLLEGLYARCALVSDVEFFEEFPSHSEVAAARTHRWTRGDWQLLPWLFGAPARLLDALAGWKLLDNLRRSLSAPASLALLVVAPAVSDRLPWAMWGLVVLALAAPTLLNLLEGLWRLLLRRLPWRSLVAEFARDVRAATLSLAMLAQNAAVMLDAVIRALYRSTISRRRLLEWVTAAQSRAASGYRLPDFVWPLRSASLAVIGSVLLLAVTHPGHLRPLAPLLLLWWLAPLIARALSLPRPAARPAVQLSETTRVELRGVARATWHFFDTFVTAAERHLPPDNFQEDPLPVVAHRTSPTNIGLYSLAIATAREFGWIGLADATQRLRDLFATLESLSKYRGHLYNWYETTSGRVLDPPYVSTVDSGNYAGALLALRQFCLAQPRMPAWTLEGLAESSRLLDAEFQKLCVGAVRSGRAVEQQIRTILETLHAPPSGTSLRARLLRWKRAEAAGRELEDLLAVWEPARGLPGLALHQAVASFRRECRSLLNDIELLLPVAARAVSTASQPLPEATLEALLAAPLSDLPAVSRALAPEARDTDEAQRLLGGASAAETLLAHLRSVADACEHAVVTMDFRFLFDPVRKVFSIGYRERENELDQSRYDLLASEARLASLVAIAKGDVPTDHWFRLGRRLGPTSSGDVLLSWSGSMFEYLMPSLLLEEPPGSLLDQTTRRVVNEQIAYGSRHGLPWGVSESALNLRDLEATYQYSPFGVPGIGLKSGLASDRVIAPYASALAACYAPLEVGRNLAVLASLGARGPYGFREAIDFTPARLMAGQTHSVVNAYMAHHQGMTLSALANLLLHGCSSKWLHADPRIRAFELLLQERPRREAAFPVLDDYGDAARDKAALAADPARGFDDIVAGCDAVQLLSNRRFATVLTGWGAGYSSFEGKALTRWRGDPTGERAGQFFYLRVGDEPLWSAGVEPTLTAAQGWHASLSDNEVTLSRSEQGIESRLQVVVSPAHNAELRRLTLVNRRGHEVTLAVTTCCEVVLAPLAADRAHPAFAKLFVQTEAQDDCLLARRRPRSDEEQTLWMAQSLTATVASNDDAEQPVLLDDFSYETDRARFVGRGQDATAPVAVTDGKALSNTVGTVLDPVFAFRSVVTLQPGMTLHLQLTTAAATERAEVLRLLRAQQAPDAFARVRSLAWSAARAELHHLQISATEARHFQTLAGLLLRPRPQLRLAMDLLAANQLGAPALWRFGLSGDRPIVVVRCETAADAEFLRQLLRGQEYLRTKWMIFDVVVLIENAYSYQQDTTHALSQVAQLERPVSGADAHPGRGDCHLLRREDLSAEELTVTLAAASVVLFASHGSLAEQLALPPRREASPGHRARVPSASDVDDAAESLEFANGFGGLAADGREYVVRLAPGQETPAPWCNVIASETAGCIVSERGSITSWVANSRENRLTPWSNDPVSDPTGEALYVRDDDTGSIWSPTAAPLRIPNATYVARHGQGWSRFQTTIDGIDNELAVFVPPHEPARLVGIRLVNRSNRSRRLTITGYAEWVLGDDRARHAHHVQTECDPSTGAIFARNPWNVEFTGRVAFADLEGRQMTWTTDRREFLGGAALAAAPEALLHPRPLSKFTGAGVDPCAALQTSFELSPGETLSLCFALGQAESADAARGVIERLRARQWMQWLDDARDDWERRLARVTIRTPDRALDLLVNRWLPYQTLVCRLWARSAFYQSGGAYGFRDQLQDCLLVMQYEPDTAREQLLRAAGRQFEAGDVQHWWHPPTGRGVRTRFSDDRLWLPFVLVEYLDRTGDTALLDDAVPFIAGPEPAPGHEDAHYQPQTLERTATVYEHAALTIDASLGVGAHGVPLIGCGDWNDGMNRIGKDGRGESVWLGWFQAAVIRRYAPLARARGDVERASRWEAHASAVVHAIEREAWDGAWYRRAWFDDGTPLGSKDSPECRIDAIAQSWSVLSASGDPARSRIAMQSVDEQLVQPETGILLLLAPPFDRLPKDPGYIKGYPPGLRENGGQYTHAAVWTAMAASLIGEHERALGYLDAINPLLRTGTRREASRYRIEPYVLAGDVYSAAPHAGRGGWSWYTGAASWYWRATFETVLGVRVESDHLRLAPRLPRDWETAEVALDAPLPGGKTARYSIVFRRLTDGEAQKVLLDDREVEADAIPLLADGREHRVTVLLARS